MSSHPGHREAAALLQAIRRVGSKRAPFDPSALCFGPQRDAIVSPATRKVLCCGRRAGKTDGVEKVLLAVGKGGGRALYVTLTRQNAKEIIWDELLLLNDKHGLGGEANISELTIRFPGGGQIQLRGAHNEVEIAKYRGKKYHLVVVDEMQSFPDRIIRPLLQSVIGPTLIDFGGQLWLVGTRSMVKAGFWWECYAGNLREGREQHAWDVRDNVMLPARLAGRAIEDILSEVRREYGWSEADPTYRREYLNEDVQDLEALLYEFREPRNVWTERPEGAWRYVVGIDIGHDDSDAIAVLGWRKHEPTVYVVEEFAQAEQDVTDLAERAKPIIERWQPERVVIDQGGLGKKIAVELVKRHGLALEPADKARKAEYIKLINADLRKGRLLAKAGGLYAEDCKLVRKDPEALMRGELRELPAAKGGYHSDITDAVLYAWRTALAFLEEPAPAKVDPGHAMMLERAQRAAKAQERPWWDVDNDGLGLGDD